jgi:hypothetical protein
MKIRHRFYLLGLFVILISACKESDIPSSTNYTYIPEELKTQFVFEKGSYWIYEDNNGNIDSVIIIESDSGFTSICPDNGCPLREYIKLVFQNVTKNEHFNYYFIDQVIKYNGGGNWGQEGQPIYIWNWEIGENSNGLTLIASYDSIEILDNMFYNIDVMEVTAKDQFQVEFEFNTDLYFSPYIGVIRRVIHDTINGTETWDLKNYNIKK